MKTVFDPEQGLMRKPEDYPATDWRDVLSGGPQDAPPPSADTLARGSVKPSRE